MSNKLRIDRAWEMAKRWPEFRMVSYLDDLIPDVPLTPELKLYSAIFGERVDHVKTRLIEAYIAIHLPKGDWEDYKKTCIEWVTGLLEESISRETELIKLPLLEILEMLESREKGVLRLRFGFEGQSTILREVGDHFGVTRERIRQIEAKALRKIRHPSRSRLLTPLRAGEWLRSRVFLECKNELTFPVLSLFWMADRQEVVELLRQMENLMDELREVEGLEGIRVDRAVSLLKRQNLMMSNQLKLLIPLVKEKYHIPITELGWSQRVVNALRRHLGTYPPGRGTGLSIPTLGEVALLSDKELLMARNFGQRCLAEVKETLRGDRFNGLD